jgi:hypothetical protein
VGEDYPRRWLDEFNKYSFNTGGINILPETVDVRNFIAYQDLRSRTGSDPIGHFARLQMTFPKSLLGYKDKKGQLDSRKSLTSLSLRKKDIPDSFKYASTALLCEVDFLTHSLLPAELRPMGITSIIIDPSRGYMDKSFWDLVPTIMPGLTAFLPAEEDLRELFAGRSHDLWEMAEAIASWGCQIVVIKQGEGGQLLYDSLSGKRYDIPAYPSEVRDLTGAGEVFSGGFMVGYKHTYSPLEAVLYGSVSASIAVENSGAFYSRHVLPGLAEARIERLQEMVRQV